jgi:hypothetical protein
MQNSCAITVGRLLEIRVGAGYRTRSEVDDLFKSITAEYAKLKKPQRVVAVTDWRHCPPISDGISNHLLEKITATNPRTQASAVIVSRDSPASALQFLRLVRSSQHPGRKLFFDTRDLLSWLHPFLTGAEFKRLQAFLDEGSSDTVRLVGGAKRGPGARRVVPSR